MYINKIDELIGALIDDFFTNIVDKKQFEKGVLNEPNFVKYQALINKQVMDYLKTVNVAEIKKIVDKDENTAFIMEVVKKYVTYYMFLTIGLFYNGRIETFINNIVEFSKNQKGFPLKINNFFNGESNAVIVKNTVLARNTKTLIGLNSVQREIAKKKDEFQPAIAFLNELGSDYVVGNFLLENIGGKKKLQGHNIIKTIIIQEVYIKQEKKDIQDMLTSVEKEQGEYTYIEIVVPTEKYIDFTVIESALTPEEINQGVATDIYNLLLEDEDTLKKTVNIEDKIQNLLNSKLVVPITDDFLLYHKDSEKYDIGSSGKEHPKKLDTIKIKYIINKLDKVADYRSERINKDPKSKDKVEKLFYTPLMHRNAILINHLEDIDIINKLQNIGFKAIENNEFYQDLMNYKKYAYVPFNDIDKDGFSFQLNKSIDAVRYVSTQISKKRDIEFIVGGEESSVNIVGLMIPTSVKPLQCLKTTELTDIRSMAKKNKKYSNGYSGFLKFLRQTTMKDRDHRSSMVWLFDLKKDKVQLDSYEQVTNLNKFENVKLMVAKLYDELVESTYHVVESQLNKHKKLHIYDSFKFLEKAEKHLLELPREGNHYNRFLKLVFQEKYPRIKKEDKIDALEDDFPGMFGDIVKLHSAKEPEKRPKMIKIILSKDYKEEEKKEREGEVNALCQHFITWENIVAIRKSNPNEFSKLIYEFVQQYVLENMEHDYICKSCGTQLPIKSYVADGEYDDSTGKFMTFATPMFVKLDDIREYHKYKGSIASIDKSVERIASMTGLSMYIGNTESIKEKRQRIVKDVIDITILHNKNMKKIYKKRNEKIGEKYGLSRQLSNLFIFPLEDSIFVMSSRERDYFKMLKRNNITSYTMFIMFSDVSRGNVTSMVGDKTCNYYWYERVGHTFFDNIKIIKNSGGDTVPIKNYPVLCYLIYYFSCLISRYNLWYFDSDKPIKKGSVNPVIQKSVIHTTVDLINSLLEINTNKEKDYLYEFMCNRFFFNMGTVFKDTTITDWLHETMSGRIVTIDGKKKFATPKTVTMNLSGKYKDPIYQGVTKYMPCRTPRFNIKLKKRYERKYYTVNNITNCPNGEFQQWKADSKTLISQNCGQRIDEISYDESKSQKIKERYIQKQLEIIALKYCKSGELHNFIYQEDNKCNVCKQCKIKEGSELSKSELDEIKKNVVKMNMAKEKRIKNRIKELNNQEKELRKAQRDMINSIKENNRKSYPLNNFIKLVKSIVVKGKGDVNINNKDVYIDNDVYIIDHDHKGISLDREVKISERDNKIFYKSEHHYFKTDVLYYTSHVKGKIDVFYDANSHILLGYREANREFIRSNKSKRYIRINYSIKNRLRLFGYQSKFMDLHKEVKELQMMFGDNKNGIISELVSNIQRQRTDKLKKLIRHFQRYINRIIYKYKEEEIEDDKKKENREKFMDKYSKLNIQVRDNRNKNRVFKNWDHVTNGVVVRKGSGKDINIDPFSKYISAEEFNKYDDNGNIILGYITSELIKLINYNQDGFTKISLIYLIFDIIIHTFDLYNNEKWLHSHDIKRFSYILNVERYLYDVMDKGHGLEGETQDTPDQQAEEMSQEQIDAEYDVQQEAEGMDMEAEMDLGNEEYNLAVAGEYATYGDT